MPTETAATHDKGAAPTVDVLGPAEAESFVEAEAAGVSPREAIPSDVAQHVVRGTSTLGLSVMVERGTAFLANILAARLGGAPVFGAYSLGIATANNISTYAAGGIGATATRFSGRYPYESGNYNNFARALAVVSGVSAVAAATVLLAGAGPIAHLLGKPALVGLLRWSALSAAGMIVLECARGFFVGQRRLAALAVLSAIVGVCMLLLVPAMAATRHATWMLMAHGSTTLFAVLVCLALAGPLGLRTRKSGVGLVPFRQILREVWGYGFIQLSGLITANLAGWWVTVLVARGDPSLVQMGFFAVASQLRNLTGLLPSLLTEGSFAVMATEEGSTSRVPHRIMALCTYASTMLSMLFASVVILAAPWALRWVYGAAYRPAALAVAVGMSVAVLQMGNSPTSARVSIVSIRATAAINTIWAVMTALTGTLWMLHGGDAAQAMAVFLASHIVMAILVLVVLRRSDHLPEGLAQLFIVSTTAMLLLCVESFARSRETTPAPTWTALMLLTVLLAIFLLYRLGVRHRWIPGKETLNGVLARVMRRPAAAAPKDSVHHG